MVSELFFLPFFRLGKLLTATPKGPVLGLLLVVCGCLLPLSIARGQQDRTLQPSVPQQKEAKQQSVPTEGRKEVPSTASKVVIVVHRLSGRQLSSWLAGRGQLPAMPLPPQLVNTPDLHTNIVAGCVLGDGRTILARLAQAEVEALRLRAKQLRRSGEAADQSTANLFVVGPDGKSVKAKFIGLDGSTGLSLLEADRELLSSAIHSTIKLPAKAEQDQRTSAVQSSINERVTTDFYNSLVPKPKQVLLNQPVRLLAPQPARDRRTPPGLLPLRLGEAKGRLAGIGRRPNGELAWLEVHTAEPLAPAFEGAVALSEVGDLIGILEQQSNRAARARLVPANALRQAVSRVLARRASVPQPWLGARGRTVTLPPITKLRVPPLSPPADGQPLESKGVLLTRVVPGAPAALAGLRAGDVVVRVGEHEVHGVEDFTERLREAGINNTVKFTVRRNEAGPALHSVSVKLRETFNPVGSMVEAEARYRALRSSLDSLSAAGLRTVMLNAKSAEQHNVQGGALVLEVLPRSAASVAGLRPGDVIEAVNNQPLRSLTLRNIGASPAAATKLFLRIMRRNQRLTLTLPLSAAVIH